MLDLKSRIRAVRQLLPRWSSTPILAALYAAGLVFWLMFFIDPTGFKWPEFGGIDWDLSVAFHSVLRQAMTTRAMPYLTSCVVNYTNLFLGLPVAPLSPQFLLLPWFSDAQFFFLNHALMYTILFAGILALRREYNLAPIPFLWLFVLFGFNGYIVSHIGVGHTMWNGYFLLPFFCLLMLRLDKRPWEVPERILMAVLFLAILLQGGFHFFVWCALYLVIVAFLQPRAAVSIVETLLLTGLLSACRTFPAVIALRHIRRFPYALGFDNPLEVVRALTTLNDFSPDYAVLPWERDFYIGTAAFLVVVFYAAQPFFHRSDGPEPRPFASLHGANLIMLFLSMGWIGRILWRIPVLHSQRVPTRLFTIPFVMWMVMASIQMDKRLRVPASNSPRFQILLAALGFAAFDAVAHMRKWRIYKIVAVFEDGLPNPVPAKLIPASAGDSPEMGLYIASVWIGLVVTLGAAFLCIWRYRRAKR